MPAATGAAQMDGDTLAFAEQLDRVGGDARVELIADPTLAASSRHCRNPHEAFVKTFKRDYARLSLKPDAASVLRQLDTWFEHYNTVHPHKALGYRSPHEFRESIVEKTTENAVGAVRRSHESTTATEAVGSRPQPPQAVARSASLDASSAVDHP